ncbi:MAG: hypothetical protein ABIL09_29915 [Gemmatimonadota bacterium]
MSLPITLIIDDPGPLINVYWWHVAERAGTARPTQESGEPVARDIPVDFLEQFIEVIDRWGVRGKYTVLPYPAGLGPIDQGWPGCDRRDLERWLDLARRHVAPRMDITPEILTHARALDLDTMAPLDLDERDWSIHQTAATLTPYIERALLILARVGLPARGVTSPWDFGAQVEEEYRLAIRQAMARVSGARQTWYFLHSDDVGTAFRSHVAWQEGDSWLVSLWAQVSDFLWGTMQHAPCEGGPVACERGYVRRLADAYLTEDGQAGRLTQLFAAGTPMVLCTHWQSLYSNGRRCGLRALDEVCRRVHQVWGDQVQWTSCHQLAAAVASGQYGGGSTA